MDNSKLSRRGFFLVAFLTILIFGPYLPPLPIVGRVRLDNIILYPLLFIIVVRFRFIVTRRYFWYYFFFMTYLVVASLYPIDLGKDYTGYATKKYIAGLDAYLRPLAVLAIGLGTPLTSKDRQAILLSIMIFVIPLTVYGLLELHPSTKAFMLKLTETMYTSGDMVYDSTGYSLHRGIISGGRTGSLFQLNGTYAMYAMITLLLGLNAFFEYRARAMRILFFIVVLVSFIAGIISGSKVFPAGILIVGVLLLTDTTWRKRMLRVRWQIALLSVFIGIIVAGQMNPKMMQKFKKYVNPSTVTISDYVGTRFIGSLTSESKLERTGMLDVIREYWYCGVGIRFVGNTTDSFWFGILAMGGVWGVLFYLAFLCNVEKNLRKGRASISDPFWRILTADLSKFLLFFALISLGFHALIQDKAGDVFWLLTGIALRQAWVGRYEAGLLFCSKAGATRRVLARS